jgi:5-methylthioadenosine/S-adenosylhomocysteine deaminase
VDGGRHAGSRRGAPAGTPSASCEAGRSAPGGHYRQPVDLDYRRDIDTTLTRAHEPSDGYAGALVSALGMIDMATTAAIDTSQVSHTPEHTEALGLGLRPSLSSDVDTTMAQDPFTLMRSTFTLQRLLLLQRARNGEENLPPPLSCRDVLECATIQGAQAMGPGDKTGSLTPGKEADIVLLRADRLNVWP